MGCATLTEITLHHICETHRACCVDLVGGKRTSRDTQGDEITCSAAARRTVSAFGLISSKLDDMINDWVQRGAPARRGGRSVRVVSSRSCRWRSTNSAKLGYEPSPRP